MIIDKSYIPQEITSLMNLIDTYVRWRVVISREERSYTSYHPSEWGYCLRRQQYKYYAWKGLIDVQYSDPNSIKHRLFDKGHNMHRRWQEYFDNIGNILLGKWKCKNILCYVFNDDGKMDNHYELATLYNNHASRIYGKDKPLLKPEKCICGCSDFEYLEADVSLPELNMKGKADLILNCDKLKEERFKGIRISYNPKFLPLKSSMVAIDMKTISSKSWKNQLLAKGPHKEYLVQLTIYIHILNCDYGIIAYENKDDSTMLWYQVPRNDEWWEIIQYQAKTMIDMASHGNKKLPPPKYVSKSSYACKQCDFRSLCHESKIWNNPKLEYKRREFYKSLL